MPRVPKEIIDLNDAIYAENGHREKCLREMCRLKQRSRTAILMEYGDPESWEWEVPVGTE